MDELFHFLVSRRTSSAHMFRRFSGNSKHQRTYVFNFKYYTVIGEECKPMTWQSCDTGDSEFRDGMTLTRCGAVVALALLDSTLR